MLAPVLVILALTLTPDPTAGEALPHMCLLCGRRAVADALLNVALFIPLGAALAAVGAGWVRTLLVGAALTVAIEIAQTWIPGRYPSSGDILTNVTGVMVGWALVSGGRALLATPARRTAFGWVAALLAPLVVAATGTLLAPVYPDEGWIVEWAPASPGQPAWDGVVRAVAIGPLPLPEGALGTGSADVAARLRAGEPIVVDALAGDGMAAGAAVLRFQHAVGHELFLLAARGDAVFVRYRTRGARLLLDQPDLRLDDALAAASPRSPLHLVVRLDGRRVCMHVGRAGSCAFAYTAGDGWRLLLEPSWLSTGGRAVMAWLWLFVLAAPAGLLAPRGPRGVALRGLTMAVGVGVAVAATGVLIMTLPQATALAAGFAAGLAARAAWRARRGASPPEEARVA